MASLQRSFVYLFLVNFQIYYKGTPQFQSGVTTQCDVNRVSINMNYHRVFIIHSCSFSASKRMKDSSLEQFVIHSLSMVITKTTHTLTMERKYHNQHKIIQIHNNVMWNISPFRLSNDGIFCIILSVPHNTVIE